MYSDTFFHVQCCLICLKDYVCNIFCEYIEWNGARTAFESDRDRGWRAEFEKQTRRVESIRATLELISQDISDSTSGLLALSTPTKRL
jgi:hypothetical protein